MTKHTDAEQEHHAGPTEITDAELDQVCGGQRAELVQRDGFNEDPQPERIITPEGSIISVQDRGRRHA